MSAAPISVSKQRLTADLRVAGTPLHHQIFDQSGSYHTDGGPLSGRLLLASCGGSFDNGSGNYEDNVFVFALPVS
ncbi:MAG: hypothetical protein EPN43_09715 [Jatrophihabitans sp.]|nr:MAG: hypothetical protein EPN43_09715 [Jatrophihabitans sp.]